MHYRLTDLNGEEWFGPDSAVGLRYVRGIDGASFEHQMIKGVGQRGRTWLGKELSENQIAIGANVHPARRLGVKGEGAVDIMSAWRDGIGEGEVERDGNQMRFELVDTGRYQAVRLFEKKPADWEQIRVAGFFFDEVIFQADDTDWYSEPEKYTFTAAQFAGAAIANPGTVEAWVGYKLYGPITNPTLGIDGEAVKLPNLTASQWLEINTEPNWYEVTDQAGVDRTFSLTTLAAANSLDDRWRKFAKPRATSIPVTITGSGTTSATKLEVTVPRIWRNAL
ncbi:hypothetical protein [uncultured Gordonia sp.]|uniref:hypothetical protein n=1 Tax=uncultured Gordonia sp. TaxID=198437 RepID=UPI00258916CB|nr:hypothetical protein [uncultured Gordonia sp.]